MARLFRRQEEKKPLWQRIKELALTDVGVLVRGVEEGSLEDIEDVLLASDFGAPAALRVIDHVETLARQAKVRTEAELRSAVEREIAAILSAGNADPELHFNREVGPTVFLITGVNGVGKTTTIGKLAHRLMRDGHRVLMAAGDTFRAGAIDQLRVWAERTGADFVGARPGADPAAVAFDALDAAVARRSDVVIVDTAGRLHTQGDLMAELAKVERVLSRKLAGAPHETLLVLDATTGQNAIMQVRAFSSALRLSGLILAKLDSTARGGIIIALKEEFDLPVKLVGTGEGPEDLHPFDADAFAHEVLTG